MIDKQNVGYTEEKSRMKIMFPNSESGIIYKIPKEILTHELQFTILKDTLTTEL